MKLAGQDEWRTFVEEFGTISPSKFSGVHAPPRRPGEILMPGGGGYGDPSRRDPAAVRRDVEEGFISEEAARTVYGLED